ncbi:hypothetical protein ABW19_dt0209667 [Dactylella cylindrospora]|nr:hypothetical protein ABW19_dt0209667 [Dactylella cylindrospora]
MLHPLVFDAHGFFYPIGNSPAVNLVSNLPPEVDADILLLGCGDVRNILFTLFTESPSDSNLKNSSKARKFHFTCCDIDGGVIARNILVLSMILAGEKHELIWPIYYDIFIPEKCFEVLHQHVGALLSCSKDTASWLNSDYGAILRFGSAQTLAVVRRFWEAWLLVLSSRARERGLSKILKNGLQTTKKLKHEGGNISVCRSAGPLAFEVLTPLAGHFDHYWNTGVTSKAAENSTKPNPTFGFSKFGERFSVHYGTDPLAGFHLATAVVPFASGSGSTELYRPANKLKRPDFDVFVGTAVDEFKMWCNALQESAGSKTITICLFVDDALELSSSMSKNSSQSTASSSQQNQLSFADSLSKGYYANHPDQFNVIDISNLIDHLGIYNLLLSVTPLLRKDFTSCLRMETLLTNEFDTANGEEGLQKVLGVDPTTIFTLFGVVPIDYISSHTSLCHTGETVLEALNSMGSLSRHGRLIWKYIPSIPWNGATKFNLSGQPHFKLAYDVDGMVTFLTAIYKKLFEVENHAWVFQRMSLDVQSKGTLFTVFQHNSRATFTLILKKVKELTLDTVDWDDLMEKVEVSTTYAAGSMIASCYLQEQNTLNYLYGVHTPPYLKEDPVLAAIKYGGMEGRGLSGNYKPVTCVTLAIPIKAFKKLLDGRLQDVGTPPFQVTLSCGMLMNHFGVLRRRFGKLDENHTISSSLVVQDGSPFFQQDLGGWQGGSDFLVSCIVPTWFLLLDGCEASLDIVSSVHTTSLIQMFGMQMRVFSSKIRNSDRVRLSTHFPIPSPSSLANVATEDVEILDEETREVGSRDWLADIKRIYYSGLARKATEPPACSVEPPSQSLTAIVSDQRKPRISSFIHRWIVAHDQQLVNLLETKAPISTTRIDSSTFTIQLGSRSRHVTFPYHVKDNTKLSIARKSKYIEIEAKVSKAKPLHVIFPVGMRTSPLNVTPWSIHRLNLEKSPLVHVDLTKYGRDRYSWINSVITLSFSHQERQQRDLASKAGNAFTGSTLTEIKESIHTIIIRYIGIQGGHTPYFTLANPGNGGGYMFLFVTGVRLDLSGLSLVADCALLPLENSEMDQLGPSIYKLQNTGKLAFVKTSNSETKAWMQLVVSLVERCRTWQHNRDTCEYLQKEKIPLSAPDLEMGISPICSCGKGIFPKSYTSDPLIAALLPRCTRIALGPIFPPPYSEKGQSLKEMMEQADQKHEFPGSQSKQATPGTCAVCSKREGAGISLLKCGRCKNREYCGKECQKKDWKVHKDSCKAK